jgi:transposase
MTYQQVTQTQINCNSINPKERGPLLTPFQRQLLTKSLETDLCKEYRHRIKIMLLADQGYSQTQICKILGCCHDTARYWTAIAELGQAHQWNDRRMGRPKVIDEPYLNRLRELVSGSPRDFGYSFERWTAQWLSKHLAKETGIQTSDRHINRLLKAMGLSTRKVKSVEQVSDQIQDNNSNRFAIKDLGTSVNADCLIPFHFIQVEIEGRASQLN